jgi:hypothetical protein
MLKDEILTFMNESVKAIERARTNEDLYEVLSIVIDSAGAARIMIDEDPNVVLDRAVSRLKNIKRGSR